MTMSSSIAISTKPFAASSAILRHRACASGPTRPVSRSSSSSLKADLDALTRHQDPAASPRATLRKALASRTKPSTGTSSARSLGPQPAGLGDRGGIGEELFRLCRSILRRWPKAACVTRSRSLARQGEGRGARPEVNHRRGHLRRRHESRGRHVEDHLGLACASPPAQRAVHRPRRRRAATMRSATSRWNIRVMLSYQGGQGSALSQPMRSGVAML